MSDYKYNKSVKNQTSIHGKKEVIITMARLIRDNLGLLPFNSLSEKGFLVGRTKKTWYIIVCHPKAAMATTKEKNNFDHFQKAKWVTRLYRKHKRS